MTGEEYFACTSDPVAAFSAPICGHMNDDHADATRAIVKHYTGLTVESANMLTVDRLGMNVQCTRDGQTFKARVPWVRCVGGGVGGCYCGGGLECVCFCVDTVVGWFLCVCHTCHLFSPQHVFPSSTCTSTCTSTGQQRIANPSRM